MNTTTLDTTNWIRIPFSVEGHNFNSVLDPEGSIYAKITELGLPIEIFVKMNQEAVLEFIKDYSDYTIERIIEVVNLGGSEAFIELAGE